MTDRTHPDSGELDGPGIVPDLQAEIERLRAEVDRTEARLHEVARHCANVEAELNALKAQKPVAWMRTLSADLPHISCVSDLEYRPSSVPESAYTPLYTRPVPSVPARLTPDGKYGQQHHYACGWNDAIDFMLDAKEGS